MSSHQLIIRKATPPTRCEICHMSDQFDPIMERCSRCESLSLPEKRVGISPTNPPARKTFIEKVSHLLGVSFLLTSGSFVCAIFTLPFGAPAISVVFLCFAVILTLSTLMLFACYCCYWGVSTIAWIANLCIARMRAKIFSQ